MRDLDIPFERWSLENGLRVVFSRDTTAPVVAVNLWYGVGSRNEAPGKTGFAHLFEHMMFQGSAHVAKGRHFELVERAGGSLNASTWFDRTNYFETVPSHHLHLALWLESDRMGWLLPAMDQEKLDNQRDVVKNEKRQRYDNQPYGDWDERLQRLVYPETHPYHHTVIGSMEDLDAASLDDVESFFRAYYVPNNAVLTICGDFDPEDARAGVERWFGEIPRGAPLPPLPGEPEIEARIGAEVFEVVESDVPLPRVYAGLRIPPFHDDAFAVAQVVASVLARGRASRLHRRLVRERRTAKDALAYPFPLLTGASMMVLWLTGYPGSDPEVLAGELDRELEAMAEVGEKEVARAVALLETSRVREIEEVEGRADLLSMYELYFGDPGRLNEEVARLRAVGPAEVRAFTEAYLGRENRALLTYLPAEARAGGDGRRAEEAPDGGGTSLAPDPDGGGEG